MAGPRAPSVRARTGTPAATDVAGGYFVECALARIVAGLELSLHGAHYCRSLARRDPRQVFRSGHRCLQPAAAQAPARSARRRAKAVHDPGEASGRTKGGKNTPGCDADV